jgi:hypothetical protein
MKMVGFTKRRRVTTWARGGVLGKTAMFFNDFPRFWKINAEGSVVNL